MVETRADIQNQSKAGWNKKKDLQTGHEVETFITVMVQTGIIGLEQIPKILSIPSTHRTNKGAIIKVL